MPPNRIDLNLFGVFEAIMRRRSVAAAGRELGLTASATSHALARLRRLLGDELFIPGPDGMQPTARATALEPEIRTSLATLSGAVAHRPFDPGTSTRTFSIASSDYMATLILPIFMQRMVAAAPSARLRVVPAGRLDAIQQLDDGRIDVFMGWFDALPGRLRGQVLMKEHEAMIVRAGHPLTRGVLTRDRLFAFRHLVVELTGSEGMGDDGFLDDHGVLRRVWAERALLEMDAGRRQLGPLVAATVPNFAMVTPTLQRTDLVATLPDRIARQVAARDDIAVLDLPYEPLEVPVGIAWHERAQADPGLAWLTDQIVQAAEELNGGTG